MSDPQGYRNAGALWRSQDHEEYEMNVQAIVNRRAHELYAKTRSEIIASVAAPVVFIAVVAWRFGFTHDRVVRWGFALVAAWVVVSLYRLRRRIWRRREQRKDAVAAASMDFYHAELQERCAHLRRSWLWFGPTFLACTIFLLAVLGRVWPVYQRMRSAAPFVALLAVWTVFAFLQRRRMANAIQSELAEIDHLKRS